MGNIFNALIIGSTLMALSACTTVPDPAEVCSPEWIQPRVNSAMADFESRTGKVIKNLRKAGEKMSAGKNIGPFQMMSLANSVTQLSNAFKSGQGIRDLKTLASTCNDPKLIKNTMTDFFHTQGVPDQYIKMLDNFQSYIDLVEPQLNTMQPVQ